MVKTFRHVSLFDLLVLRAIVERGGFARNSELVEALGVDHTAIISAVKKLSALGFVEIEPRRGYRITQKGQEFIKSVEELWAK